MRSSILAIDPGYDRCGWAVLEKNSSELTVINKGCIQTHKSSSLFERYDQLVKDLQEIFSHHSIHELAMESLFFSKNVSTAIAVAQVRGLIMCLAIQHDVQLYEYTPSQIKLAAAGQGSADKKSVDKMVRLQLKIDMKEKIIDDTIDALAIGITHVALRKNTRYSGSAHPKKDRI